MAQETRDAAFLQHLVNSTAAGGTAELPPVAYRLTAPVVIDRPLTLAGRGATVVQTVPDAPALIVRASGVTLTGLTLRGAQHAARRVKETAVLAHGASNAEPVRGLRVLDCRLDNWGMYGVSLRFADDFAVEGCSMTNIHHGGIIGFSVRGGSISRNRIARVVGQPNAYGITLSRITDEPGGRAANPPPEHCLVADNLVEEVLYWHGLDTHGGRGIIFRGNRVLRCASGIAVGGDTPRPGNEAAAPESCVVTGNVIDSGRSDGLATFGVCVTGLNREAPATGCVVAHNAIKGHGRHDQPYDAAVYCHSTRGLVVQGNTIVEPSPQGANLWNDNDGFTFTGNTVIDPWTDHDKVHHAAGFVCWSERNRGVVVGNTFVRGARRARWVMTEPIRTQAKTYPSNQIDVVGNVVPE